MKAFRIAPQRGEALARFGFPLALLLILLYLLLRNSGAYPVVFADEWLYSKFARLQPLSESQLPSWLYLKLYGYTNACGEGFLGCARIANTALLMAAAPLVYRVARPLVGKPSAALIGVWAVLAPINGYSAYFMPETMYFCGFWVLSYTMLRGATLAPAWRPTLAYAALGGVVLGTLSLIKVHALFLLPAMLLFVLFARRSAGRAGWLAQALAAAGLLAALTFIVKLALGYLLAGRVGLSLFGSFYGGQVSNGAGLSGLLAPALHNLLGHSMGLLMLFAFPLLMLAGAAASASVRSALGRRGRALLVYAILTLGAALGMTVLYTASIADAGPQEIIRLHLRYYDFTFPLLMIAGVAIARHSAALSARLRAMLAAALALLVLLAAWQFQPHYLVSLIDSPELYSLVSQHGVFLLLIALQLALLALWAARPQYSVALYLLGLTPLYALTGEAANTHLMMNARQPQAWDQAGRLAHAYLTPEQRAKLSIAGSDLAGLSRAQFQVDHAGTAIIELPADAPFALNQTPVRQQWLLVVGKHALPASWTPVLSTPDYALVRLQQESRSLLQLDMRQPLQGGILTSLEGLADAEHWGSWSNAKTVRLQFSQPLPEHLTVLLNGRAFGPNVGRDFILRVGDAQVPFQLPATTQELFLKLNTDGRQHTLQIEVPQPTAPQGAAGSDQRLLGIGLIGLEIGVATAAVAPH